MSSEQKSNQEFKTEELKIVQKKFAPKPLAKKIEKGANFFFAKTLSDVFYQLKSIPELKIVGGCTGADFLGKKILSVYAIPELLQIEKREHFLDFGAALPLSEILKLGKNREPAVLYDAILSVANPFLRNLATIGGNLCTKKIFATLYAPLLALDAKIEIAYSEQQSAFLPISKFLDAMTGKNLHPFVKKIRIPTEDWEIEIFRRTGAAHSLCEDSASFAFLADSQKGVLANLRIAFAGPFAFRNAELENHIVGARLPLSEKIIEGFLEEAQKIFDSECSAQKILRDQFFRFLRFSLQQMSV